jgi:hypothetical protein
MYLNEKRIGRAISGIGADFAQCQHRGAPRFRFWYASAVTIRAAPHGLMVERFGRHRAAISGHFGRASLVRPVWPDRRGPVVSYFAKFRSSLIEAP